MKWVVAADHGGVGLKTIVVDFLLSRNLDVEDLGGFDACADDAYPEDADRLVDKILSKEAEYGVLICGTGIGISIRANRYKGIRAALIYDEFTAKSAKGHNNANVICFGARVLSSHDVLKYLTVFMEEEFEGGRHKARVEKLDAPLLSEK